MADAPPTLPLPTADAALLRSRAEALAAFTALGWRPYATPLTLDAARRRILNIDLTEPEVALWQGAELAAVAHLETDRAGLVTHVEVTAVAAVPPDRVAAAILGQAGEPRVGGDDEARQWVWGPEAGTAPVLARGEPVRLWVCAERAYAGRLWAVLSVVRRG